MSDDVAAFGALLRAHRLAANLSQEELAERTGLSAHAISGLERGRTRSPHRSSVNRLADALDLRAQARTEFIAAAGRRLSSAAAPPGEAGAPAGDRAPQASSTTMVPRQLPAAPGHFTGRQGELNRLTTIARSADARTGTVVISAIDGMAGIGKTAFAVHAAHRLAEHFPDGQLFLDLHGYTQGHPPRTANDALARLLGALGVPPERIRRTASRPPRSTASTCPTPGP